MKVAFLEDDEVIRSNYTDLLESEGYEVHTMSSYQEAIDGILSINPDFAILDIDLPDDELGGIKICKFLRERRIQIPVIFFTSHTELDPQSKSWRAGADDYVTKDTNVELVLLRIKALLKRYEAIQNPGELSQTEGLNIDKKHLTAFWGGTRLPLSLTQFWMLEALASSPGQVFSHQQLQISANIVVEPNTIAAYIKSIRDIITDIDSDFGSIKTERGKGYRWVE